MDKSKYLGGGGVPPIRVQLESALGDVDPNEGVHAQKLRKLLNELHADSEAVTELEDARRDRSAAERIERWDSYFQIPKFLDRSLKVAHQLGLADHAGAEMIDIGCGPSFLGYTVRQLYGIECIGLDLPRSERSISWRIAAALRQPIVAHRLEPLRPLPDLERRFDIATIISPQFYRKGPNAFWTEDEWSDLFDQIFRKYLKAGGWLMMRINLKKRLSEGFYDHADMIAAIDKVPGSSMRKGWVHLPRPD